MKYITLRIVAGLVLLAALAGVALLAYNAGAAHQVAITAQTPTVPTGSSAYPIFWWPFPFFGFGFLALLVVFFLVSIAFGALRMMLWGPRFGWRRWHRGYGFWGERGSGEDIPPMFSELHRRMHQADEGKAASQPTQKQS
jgi:hypothetical protein